MKEKLLSLFALLLTMTQGAWADDYTTTAGGATAGGDGKVIITWYGTTHP